MRVQFDSGEVVEIGEVETAPTIGITDYSRRETDDFGVTTVVERPFSRIMSVRLSLPTSSVDAVQRRLADLRATPALWIADDDIASLKFRGFYKEFSIDLAVPPTSFITLTVESLVAADPFTDSGIDPAPDGGTSTLRLLQPIAVTGAMLVASNVDETDAPEWSAGTPYALGARVIKAAAHRIYESAGAGNLGNDPAGTSGQWIDTGATNRWRMFDEALGSTTGRAGGIDVTIAPGAVVDAVALLDVSGASVRVQAQGYDRTLTATGPAGSVLFLDLPATAGNVRVTVAGTGNVSIGTLLIGRLRGLGITEASPSAGITDFSRKDTDEFGEVTVVERAWAKKMSVRSLIRSDAVDLAAGRIASVRARPSLWIGSDGLDTLTVYGFFKDFSAEIGTNVSTVSLSIEGMSAATKVSPLSVSVDWADLNDRTGTKPEPNATNSANPNSAFGNTTVGALNARIVEIGNLVGSIQDALENTDVGDSGIADAARKAAEAARDAAILARDAAAASAQVALNNSGDAAQFAFTAQAAAQFADASRAAAALLITAAARTSVGLLNPNANFLDYPAGVGASPANWSTNGSRVAGANGPYAVRLAPSQSVIQVDKTRIVGGSYLVIEVDVSGDGNLDDIFIGLQGFDDGPNGGGLQYGSGWYLGHETPIDYGAKVPVFSAVNYETYRYRIFVSARVDAIRNFVIYAENIGGGDFRIGRLGYRFATPGEVDGKVARDQLTSKADYQQLVQLGTDMNAAFGRVDQHLATEFQRVDGRIDQTYSLAASKASTGFVQEAVSSEAGARAQLAQNTSAEFQRVDGRIDQTYSLAESKASTSFVQNSVASEAGARAQAIADQRVSYNGRSLSLQEFGSVLATPDGKLQGLWGVSFNNGTPVLSIYYRDDNGNIQQGAYLAGDLTLDGTLTARKVVARGITQQYGAVLGQELVGELSYSWQAGPTINFDLEYDADVLVIGTGGNGYYGSLAGFESAIAIDGNRGAAGGGNAAATGSYSLPISMSGSIRLPAGSHSAQFQWRGMSSDVHLGQATLIVLRAYC